ncbi:MAG: hypothetical protein ACE37J_05190 [Pikeienuella sp.]|uniref:hypothetical protein n=1 Tax=Pikeienuella sp. TaxID=2831957 RepID=UPI00391A4575
MGQPRVASRLGRVALRLGFGVDPLGEAMTAEPEIIEAGETGAPVEIWVGTHPSMLRSTRVLVWSALRALPAGRRVRFHLMSNLKGVAREGWNTGWQGYAAEAERRAGGKRSLYCDATFLFETDPAALFDASLNGFLDLTRSPAQGAEPLPRPFPWETPRGAAIPAGEGTRAAAWRAAEAAADAARFMLFTKARPTREFGVLIGLYQRMHEENFFPGGRLKHHVEGVKALLGETGAQTILDYGAGKAEGYDRIPGEPESSPWRAIPLWPGVKVRCFDPGVPAFSEIGGGTFGGVISTDVVEHLAPFDAPWVLDEMFGRAERFVFVIAACFPAIKTLPDGRNAHTAAMNSAWWRDEMAAAGAGYPEIEWRIGCDAKGLFGKSTKIFGGRGAMVRV